MHSVDAVAEAQRRELEIINGFLHFKRVPVDLRRRTAPGSTRTVRARCTGVCSRGQSQPKCTDNWRGPIMLAWHEPEEPEEPEGPEEPKEPRRCCDAVSPVCA